MAKERQPSIENLVWARWTTIVIAVFVLMLTIKTAKISPDKEGVPDNMPSPITQHLRIRAA